MEMIFEKSKSEEHRKWCIFPFCFSCVSSLVYCEQLINTMTSSLPQTALLNQPNTQHESVFPYFLLAVTSLIHLLV